MRPEQKSQLLLGVTRSKAKMLEYSVPEEYHIKIAQNPAKLFTISIGLLGDLAAAINRNETALELLSEMQSNLNFSAQFFDSYFQSKLNEALDPYLLLLGSASYYLCDSPGSASVLARKISDHIEQLGVDGLYCPNLEGEGLEFLLLWLLQSDVSTYFSATNSKFGKHIDKISYSVCRLFLAGEVDHLESEAAELREHVYYSGSPRQLLFCDVICAVIKKKIINSSWICLPHYSGLPKAPWSSVLKKRSFIKELWPAQHLLGKASVLKGKSAIIQMPTSAGKTKSIELILRSAFLAGRTSLAIIIAPFRALCSEIKDSLSDAFHDELIKVDELSDALQADFDIADLIGHQQILVVTPEKLVYVLRHAPALAAHAGLLVFDEGHQFDSGTRGITYELLLTSLRPMISETAQKVLISAVISNAEAVGEWLNGEPNVIEGATLTPTFRSIGFASWLDQLGRIEYVDSRNAEQNDFFVPRVINRHNLGKRGREKTDRSFPERDDGQSIALYLGLKLVRNGSIAIFCGTKLTAASVCEKAVDIIARDAPIALPLEFSNAREVERLKHLHIENLGAGAPASHSAAHGIFSHHGNTPHGIRLAVEHAMRNNLVRFVVCTSTLAQGVNLPIRYLIVTSVYQGRERIKVRDFHNLIGRAGRAGMHTEGSILFADPDIYDKRKSRNDKWRWEQVKDLLEPSNSEPCISNLLSIFEPIKSDDERYIITVEAVDFAKTYINEPEKISQSAAEMAAQHGGIGFSQLGIERQFAWRISLICAIESFLLSHWDETEHGILQVNAARLAEETLAFFLADDQKKEDIRELFQIIAENISEKIKDPVLRRIYGRTLYGVQDAQTIEQWIQSNAANLLSITDATEVLDLAWPLLIQYLNGGVFARFDKPEVIIEIARGWISGQPFSELLEIIHKREAKMIWGTKRRALKIDHVVDACEGTLAYDGALLAGALCELAETLYQSSTEGLIPYLQIFQKRLKYGLPTEATIALYELGFSDRVISQDLAASLNLSATQKKDILNALKLNRAKAKAVMEKYPSYFQGRLSELIG